MAAALTGLHLLKGLSMKVVRNIQSVRILSLDVVQTRFLRPKDQILKVARSLATIPSKNIVFKVLELFTYIDVMLEFLLS